MIEAFDGDQAVAEALVGLEEERTRSGLLKGAGGLAGLGFAAALWPRSASARSGGSKANDVKILNYALTLEYLEAAFYAEAIADGIVNGEVLDAAKIIGKHEADHVAALKKALGSAAVKKPKFDFGDVTQDQTKFIQTAVVLEDTG